MRGTGSGFGATPAQSSTIAASVVRAEKAAQNAESVYQAMLKLLEGVPTPAPAPTPGPVPGLPSIAVAANVADNIYQTGNYFVHENVWGAGTLTRGVYTGLNGSTYEQYSGVAYPTSGGGPVAARWAGKYATGTDGNEVKAYPSIIAGNKPGWGAPGWPDPGGYKIILPDGSTSTAVPAGKTPNSIFPLALPLTSLKSTYAYNHNQTPTGRGHLAYDIWLQNTAIQKTGFNTDDAITTEIMIPLSYWGGYGKYIAGGGGRNPSWYVKDLTVDGILWHCFHATPVMFGHPWHFVVFEPEDALPNRQINLAAIINAAISEGWAPGATHCVSVELGVEPVDGTYDLTVYNFDVTL
jgi:hypothetical protein